MFKVRIFSDELQKKSQQLTSEERYGKYLTPKYRDLVFLMTKTQAKNEADQLALVKKVKTKQWQETSNILKRKQSDNQYRIGLSTKNEIMSYLYIRSNYKGQCHVNLNLSTEITLSFLLPMTYFRNFL